MLSFFTSALTAFFVVAALGPCFISLFQKWHFGQNIRSCGPAEHRAKSGTPTMGGLFLLAGLLAALGLWTQPTSELLLALGLILGYALIGFSDDCLKLIHHENLGLTARQKFALQIGAAGLYLYAAQALGQTTTLWLPGTAQLFDCGYFYYPFALLLLVGTTNAVNLTDGLDGLVSLVTLPVAVAFSYIACSNGQAELRELAAAVAGACAGFLLYNRHPARIFMGDTGSLALGGAVAALALATRTELLLIILGGVYVAEALSVILQVGYFRLTHGQRLLRMSPLHHHFELGGWPETKVVTYFAAASSVLALLAVYLWRPH